MLSALWMVYFSFGLAVFSMAPLVETIREDLGISKGAMGAVLGAWPLVYLVAALPSGALVDRLGLRRSLGVATVIISASALLRPVAGNGSQQSRGRDDHGGDPQRAAKSKSVDQRA